MYRLKVYRFFNYQKTSLELSGDQTSPLNAKENQKQLNHKLQVLGKFKGASNAVMNNPLEKVTVTLKVGT